VYVKGEGGGHGVEGDESQVGLKLWQGPSAQPYGVTIQSGQDRHYVRRWPGSRWFNKSHYNSKHVGRNGPAQPITYACRLLLCLLLLVASQVLPRGCV
jgi:hypothetical protein